MTPQQPNARFRRRWAWWIMLFVLAGLMIADQCGLLLVRRHDDLTAYHGVRTTVLRVIDGDTIEVAIPDIVQKRSATRLTLIGVNCPEPARTGVDAEPLAAEAASFATSMLAGSSILLWLESHHTRDGFGRIPAHIELPDGSMLNEELLAAGLACVDERVPHSMLTRYAQTEWSARRKGLGRWAKDPPAQ